MELPFRHHDEIAVGGKWSAAVGLLPSASLAIDIRYVVVIMCAAASLPEDCESRLRAGFDRYAPLSNEAWGAISGDVTRVEVARHAPLFEAGAIVDRLFFVTQGVVRLSTFEGDREVTLGFECEDRFLTDLESFLTGGVARMSAIALEDLTALTVSRSVLVGLYDHFPVWERIGRLAMEDVVLHKIDKERRIRTMSAEQRYLAMCESDSWLLQRVPQYHLAAYLGITPETLSRIRSRS